MFFNGSASYELSWVFNEDEVFDEKKEKKEEEEEEEELGPREKHWVLPSTNENLPLFLLRGEK